MITTPESKLSSIENTKKIKYKKIKKAAVTTLILLMNFR